MAVKLYHYGFCNLNGPIQEALLRMKVDSAYTCRLLDISICKSSKDLFEVGLVMERLEGDLAVDIRSREVIQASNRLHH